MKKIFKYLCSAISIIGLIHLESLALEAILFHFSWCGTPQLLRTSVSIFYFILAPFVLLCLVISWRKKTRLDCFIRISCLSFLAALSIYWFFEFMSWGSWLAYLWEHTSFLHLLYCTLKYRYLCWINMWLHLPLPGICFGVYLIRGLLQPKTVKLI